MPIVGSAWSSTLKGTLSGMGMNGSQLQSFTDAVGLGSTMSIVGKAFTTTDVGLIPGVGVGVGAGITGLSPMDAANLIYGNCSAFGFVGARLHDFCTACGSALVSTLADAILSSTHAPVWQGAGSVVTGSIAVVPSEWGSNIHSAAAGFMGSKWPDFANAIGAGSANHVIAKGTGSVVISGSFTGPTPPGPLPGAGVGAGTIS
jgi:hypothetical protein